MEIIVIAVVLLVVVAVLGTWLALRSGRNQRLSARAQVSGFNPLATLSFDEFLDPVMFSERVSSNASSWLNTEAGAEARKTIEALADKDAAEGESLNKNMATLLGRAAATLLKGGRVGPNFVPFIFILAYLMKSLDQAQRLSRIERQLDFMVRLRNVDQRAELQSIFEGIQYQCSLTQNRNDDAIRAFRDQLRKLRYTCVGEMRHAIENVPSYGERNSLKRKLSPARTQNQLHDELAAELNRTVFLRSVVQLEQVVHLVLNESEYYFKVGFPETLRELDKIANLTRDKLVGTELGVKGEALVTLVPAMMDLLRLKDEG